MSFPALLDRVTHPLTYWVMHSGVVAVYSCPNSSTVRIAFVSGGGSGSGSGSSSGSVSGIPSIECSPHP